MKPFENDDQLAEDLRALKPTTWAISALFRPAKNLSAS
jgi:hypothetical protein